MEVKTIMHRIGWIRTVLCALVLFISVHGDLYAQPALKKYSVKDGKMYIMLGRTITDASLDSFIRQFSLGDLGLKQFVRNNSSDSLKKLGWEIEMNNKIGFLISKPLMPVENIDNPANKISLTEKHPTLAEMFPSVSSGVQYGFNRVRKGFPFTVNDSMVTFFLRNHTNARTVILSGSFNDWSPDKLKMKRSDSGWTAVVKLGPGKFWYKYVVDENWIIDNNNLLQENDGLGNTNSVFFRPNIVFTFKGLTNAKKVFLAGSFNNWRRNELQLSRTADGWALPLYLARGTHTYKLVVDGEWFTDENAEAKFPDGRGGMNSVIRIGKPHVFKLNGFSEAKQVVLAGNFNLWRDNEIFLTKTNQGWEVPYTLGPGNYEYKFKVDSKWIMDPENKLQVRSDQNTFNSFLIIEPNYTFRLKGHKDAKAVYLAGDLNNWNPDALLMKKDGDDWVIRVHLSPGKHRYKFVVDGKWILDPGNDLWEQNEHMTGNSIIWIDAQNTRHD